MFGYLKILCIELDCNWTSAVRVLKRLKFVKFMRELKNRQHPNHVIKLANGKRAISCKLTRCMPINWRSESIRFYDALQRLRLRKITQTLNQHYVYMHTVCCGSTTELWKKNIKNWIPNAERWARINTKPNIEPNWTSNNELQTFEHSVCVRSLCKCVWMKNQVLHEITVN